MPVQLTALDDRVQILDYRPRQVPVRLDPIVSKDVPVTGGPRRRSRRACSWATSSITPATVTVRGGSTLVAQVTHAVASVIVDPNGIDVDPTSTS